MTQGTAPSAFPRDLKVAGDMRRWYGVTDNDADELLFNLCCTGAGFRLGGYPDKAMDARKLTFTRKLTSHYPGVQLHETEIYPHLKRTTTGQRFFTCPMTPAVGIGPSTLRDGDEIWVLAGGEYPVALRPVHAGSVSRRKYHFVGEVYLNSPRPDIDDDIKTPSYEY